MNEPNLNVALFNARYLQDFSIFIKCLNIAIICPSDKSKSAKSNIWECKRYFHRNLAHIPRNSIIQNCIDGI